MEHGRLSALDENIKFLEQSQFWSPAEITKYQEEKLAAVLDSAFAHIPFYRDLYREHGLKRSDIRGISDLSKLPTVNKEMMRHLDYGYLEAVPHEGDISFMTTGGSTGNPFKIYMDESFRSKNHANTYFYLAQLGFPIGSSRNVRLHGDTFTEEEISKGAYSREMNGRTLVLSSNHISEITTPMYVEKMNAFGADYLHAFPSSLYVLATFMKKLGLKLKTPVRAVFSDCECLYPHQKALFIEVFGCKVFNIYGHTEGSVFGMNCPRSDLMHLNPMIGFTEILDDAGRPVSGEGERGEITVTGFYNRVMPFIRYRTGDIGICTKKKCNCGRNWFFLNEVEGRKQDYVVTREKSVLPLAPTLFDYIIDWSGVDRFQVQQNEPGKLHILFMLNPSVKSPSEVVNRVCGTLGKSFGSAFQIQSEIVKDIPCTQRGKYRYLVQNLKIEDFWGQKT